MGKPFTTVLNNRLTKFQDSYNVICEGQAVFHQKCSTVDHIFSLKLLIDYYLLKRQNSCIVLSSIT